jgi:hypothetical protein
MNRNRGIKDERRTIEVEGRAMWFNYSWSITIEINPVQTAFSEAIIETIPFRIIADNDTIFS